MIYVGKFSSCYTGALKGAAGRAEQGGAGARCVDAGARNARAASLWLATWLPDVAAGMQDVAAGMQRRGSSRGCEDDRGADKVRVWRADTAFGRQELEVGVV